jgi:hypothetical protein
MSLIPATQEVDTGRIMVQGQPSQKFKEIPSQSISWVWNFRLVIPATWET